MKNLEVQTRRTLNLNFMILYLGENKSKIFEQLNERYLIRSSWEKLTRSGGHEKIEENRTVKIVTKWIDIRVNAFLKTLAQIIKRKDLTSGTWNDGCKEVVLQKTLSTSSHILDKRKPSIKKSLTRMLF